MSRQVVGGLGDCPHAPGVRRHVGREDPVRRLDPCGSGTCVDAAFLIERARILPSLIGHVSSQPAHAGRRLDVHSLPAGLGQIRERAATFSL